MYRSSVYAGERTKSVFVEMSECSADTARLLQHARGPEPLSSARQARFWVRRIVRELLLVLEGLGQRVTCLRGDVHPHVASSKPNRST